MIKRDCFFIILLFQATSGTVCADSFQKGDSIIRKILERREFYCNYIDEYDATVYLKGNVSVRKKNFLYRYAPNFMYLSKRGEDVFAESLVRIQFDAPNSFTQNIIALNGSKLYSSDVQERLIQFLNLNIYNPTLFNDLVLFPGEKEIFKYYRFEYVTEIDTLGFKIHEVKMKPKIRSQKLISGSLYIIDGLWSVAKSDIRGKFDFSEFRVETLFSTPEEEFFPLPKESSITFTMKLLGNETVHHHFSSYCYNSIRKGDKDEIRRERGYDLSSEYLIESDTIPYIRSGEFWEAHRSMPLTDYDRFLIEAGREKLNRTDRDTVIVVNSSFSDISRGTISPKKIKYNNSYFSYSGLINPLKLYYSKRDGFVYWQQFRYRQNFPGGKELSFSPNIGYLFKSREFYFKTPINWEFQPRRFGRISFNFGNKNQSYNFKTINLINEEIPDTIDFEDFKLDYYRHFYFSLDLNYEIANGLQAYAGLDYNWYSPVREKEEKQSDANNLRIEGDDVNEDIVDIVENKYRNFSPVIGLRWTPGQYYRFNRNKKEYLFSRYPTFTLEYSRAFRGVFNSNSDYERIEVAVEQKIPVGLMRSVQYHVGGGGFSNSESFYFADFSLFQKKNFPQSWNDPIGGVFHLLDGKWYNASKAYFQGHFMYESPFIILQFFRGVTKDILMERFYFSQLYTSALPCYTELGYGVGNFIGNIGAFVSLKKGKFDSFGLKFAFEIGR